MTVCKYCKKEFDKSKIATHTKWCFENPKRGEGVLKTQHKYCKICGKEIFCSRKVRRRTCDNPECIKEIRKHSEQTKKIMSEKRKQWLVNNPNKHPWKNNKKFISAPCEELKAILIKNCISFEEEFTPLPDRFFSIDIFIASKNIGIEVNGNQHYDKYGNLKKYYNERHKAIEQSGITLIEIHYSLIYNEVFLQKLITSIQKSENICVNEYKKDILKSKKQEKTQIRCQKEHEKMNKINKRIEIITLSGVDFTHHGWVTKISKILNISTTQVRRFMLKYMKNFYDSCFIRKPCKT